MPQDNKKPGISFSTWFLIFIIGFFGYRLLFPAEQTEQVDPATVQEVVITPTQESYTMGNTVVVNIENTTENVYQIKNNCPSSPLAVYYTNQSGIIDVNNAQKMTATSEHVECEESEYITIEPNTIETISFAPWNQELFGETGNYLIVADLMNNGELANSVNTSVEINNPNFIAWIWEIVIYTPIYNALIFLVSILPGYSLGLGIIVLTVIIRLILLVPNQHALRSQKAMQELQPKLNELKRKYANDQQKLAQETMALWKKYKINPFGGCLPLLIQLPIIIGLFYSIKSANYGFSSSDSALLYGNLKNFDMTQIQTTFLGLDLRSEHIIWLAVVVALLQFFQMSLAMAKNKKKAKVSGEGIKEKKKDKSEMQDAMAQTTKTMQYIMPLMIGFMAYSFPAGVAIYWGMSTLFGIGQQLVVNREKIIK